MTDPATRQLPALDGDNDAFWTGGRDGRLMIHRCRDCARYIHPPLPHCGHCGGANPVPTPVSGHGRVAAFTVNHQPWLPGMAVPYVFAAVELAEQAELYVLTNIVSCDPEAVRQGMAVAVRFEQHGEIFLPLFTPAAA